MERVNTSGRTIELAPAHSANANTVAAIRTTGTLTDVIRQHRIDRIDLLKIDVEESELDVLAGIADGDWSKIKQVVIEVESKRNLDLVVAKLKEHEYQVFVDKVDHGFSSDSPAPSHSYPNGDIDGDDSVYALRYSAPGAGCAIGV